MGPVQTWIEHLFLRRAVKPCDATQSCCACRTGARLPALRPCASQSLRRLRTGPSHPWLGRSPGQQSTGLLFFSGSPCCAWKTGTAHPCSVRSPGQSLRLRTPCVAWAPAQAFLRCRCPASLESPGRAVRGTPVHRAKGPPDPWQCPGSPVAWAFAGTSVHRTLALFRLTHRTVVFLRRTHRTLVFAPLSYQTFR